MVRRYWRDPEACDGEAHKATVISLHKNKGKREDLENHRGICLLTVISRLVARVAAMRLSAFAERHKIFRVDQWGS